MTVRAPVVEIREFGRPARRRRLSQPIVVGRDGAGEVLVDDQVSRHHLRLVPTPTALSVVDLGSRNGTTVNGVGLTNRATLAPGDVVRLGRSEIVVLETAAAEPASGVEPEHDATRHSLSPAQAPPPPPSRDAAPARVAVLAERALGIDTTGRELFPAFTELTSRVPLKLWQAVRIGSVAAYLTVVVLMFVRPSAGLFVFFRVIVPLLPILLLVAPGLWRNICPLAATNQTPRLLRFSLGLNSPGWLRNRGYAIAMTLFFGIAGARLAGLDRNGAAMGAVLCAVLATAFLGGLVFKGKSGWCSSICPLLPLQRIYGQTPYVTVPNTHCTSCVGCAKNCYDFKPRAAWQADLAERDRGWSGTRKLFAAALPGFVLGFFVVGTHSDEALMQKYSLLGLSVVVGIGLFFTLEALTSCSPALLSVTFAAATLNIFYWFVGPVLAASLAAVVGVDVSWMRWPISVTVAALTLLWVARTRVAELQFAVTTGQRSEPVLLQLTPRRTSPAAQGTARVSFDPDGTTVAAEPGTSLLEIAEKCGRPIEAGCRMGVCGADPVAVLEGMDHLSAPERDELNTLRRLGLAGSTRMACCARITAGEVKVSLTPAPGDVHPNTPTNYDRAIVSVVVLGHGIAGVTAADFIRRGHPDCEIHLVGRESHPLYNRMGISRLVHGRSAMQGLYLLSDDWYDDHGVTAWLNTVASRVDLRRRQVLLGTGDNLPYDRLILAMGSSAARPPICGLDRPGSFVLRDAGDAMQIRAYAQHHRCRRAVVAGGGLLGLEAAYSLHLLGLDVTVLERGKRLLSRQLDPRCSALVESHFAEAGIQILRTAEPSALTGTPDLSAVVLKDGRTVTCELFLAATGIRPNIELARDAGVPVNRGVLVDDGMRTSIPDVFAAGDVAEHAGQVFGLWPIATDQAQVAAVNALGGAMTLTAETPATILKGAGLELFSAGRVAVGPGDEEIVAGQSGPRSYRRLVLSHGVVVGGIVAGHHPGEVAAVRTAIRTGTIFDAAAQAALRAGDWSVLSE